FRSGCPDPTPVKPQRGRGQESPTPGYVSWILPPIGTDRLLRYYGRGEQKDSSEGQIVETLVARTPLHSLTAPRRARVVKGHRGSRSRRPLVQCRRLVWSLRAALLVRDDVSGLFRGVRRLCLVQLGDGCCPAGQQVE